MLLPCEIAVKFVLPSVRAAIATRLISNYGLKQMDAAKLLGISQPAISLYTRRLRGGKLHLEDYPDLTDAIDKLAGMLVNGYSNFNSFVEEFCRICRLIKSKGLLCSFHKLLDSNIDASRCDICKCI
ncbi:MAG: transcriptional regulator [Candidatus Methanomethylicia archaeon]